MVKDLLSRRWRADRDRRRLSDAISRLPLPTRRAMLVAIADDELIAGAYTDRRGRLCPLLAAHRRGGRASVSEFAHAWDRFTRARRPRRATVRELQLLATLLQEHTDTGTREIPKTSRDEHREIAPVT